MKKRIAALAMALVFMLSGTAMANVNNEGVSLVSLNYLKGAYWTMLETLAEDAASKSNNVVYTLALAKLEEMSKGHLASLGQQEGEDGINWQRSGTFSAQSGESGDTITLSGGSGLLWTAGNAQVQGGLIDATAGSEVADGALTPGHRYLADEQSIVTVTSRTAHWAVEGKWTTTADGISVVELPFVDVREGNWYYDAVLYVVEKGLFNGVSATEFAPLSTMQRGMLTTVLYRMEGEPAVQYSAMFSDVPDRTWYTNGVIWAGGNGIVNGVGDGLFAPKEYISRQQIAVILYNYAKAEGYTVSFTGTEVDSFEDGGAVSSWARDAVNWAVSVGILKGSANSVRPRDNANRAEVAVMLQRFQTWIDAN